MSLLCALSGNALSLIIFRIIQAAGAASASVISMAITKDLYEGHERQRLLAYMWVIMALALMLAPVIGAWIMTWFSWPWIFVCQGAIGVFAWGGVFFLKEPLKERSAIGVKAIAGMYLQLLKNKKYLALVALFSLIVLPHFSFIGSAADIYINKFSTSEQAFGYFFAFNALAIMSGSYAFTRLHKVIESSRLLTLSFAGIFLSGMLMYSGIFSGPWGLALPMAVASFSFGLSRPPSNNLILEQVEQGAGTASSFMIFIYFMIGAFSMWLISLDWTDKIHVISILALFSGGIVLTAWFLMAKKATSGKIPLRP